MPPILLSVMFGIVYIVSQKQDPADIL